MTEERALKIFARCYNAGDFARIVRLLSKKATYEAFNRFYISRGKDAVAKILGEKAAELRSLPEPNRAYHGFTIVKHDIIGTRAEPCVVLTKADPWKAEGVVRIRCSMFRIKGVQIMDPAKYQHTRGDYAGGEGR